MGSKPSTEFRDPALNATGATKVRHRSRLQGAAAPRLNRFAQSSSESLRPKIRR